MLDMTLGTGIGLGSLFIAAGTVGVTWINNVYKSNQRYNDCSSDKKNLVNSYVRRGEYDQFTKSLQQQLGGNHKENKDWWRQLDKKIDSIQSELLEIRKVNDNHVQRIATIEAIQKTKD